MISVIILTYNRINCLVKCLDSLSRQSYPKDGFEVIVVDDGSTDDTGALIGLQYSSVKYFYKEHGGISSARNFGIKKAEGGIVAFIDDDCEVPSDWVRKIYDFHKLHPDVPAIQGRIDNFFKGNIWAEAMQYSFEAIKFQKSDDNLINLIATGNVSFKKGIFNKVGYFDEKLPRCEDFDMAYRISCAWGKILYEDEIVVYHHHRLKLTDLIKQQFTSGRSRFLLDFKWKGKVDFKSITKNKKSEFWKEALKKEGPRGAIILFAVILRKLIFSLGYAYERFFCFNNYSDSK